MTTKEVRNEGQMTGGIIEIDVHGKNTEEAKKAINMQIHSAGKSGSPEQGTPVVRIVARSPFAAEMAFVALIKAKPTNGVLAFIVIVLNRIEQFPFKAHRVQHLASLERFALIMGQVGGRGIGQANDDNPVLQTKSFAQSFGNIRKIRKFGRHDRLLG